MINNASDETGEVPEAFSCPLCLGLVHKPLTCTICQNHLFCQDCVGSMQGVKACPMCQRGSFVGCNKLVTKMLTKLMVRCNEFNCCKNGELMNYTHFIDKHVYECQVKNMDCPLECGANFSSR